MYRYLILLCVSAFSLAAFASCDELYYKEAKPNVSKAESFTKDVQEVCYTEFEVLYSHTLNAPMYAAQKITPKQIRGANDIKRINSFHAEPRVGAVVKPRDYVGSKYDKGHLSPAGDAGTHDTQQESFSMANMVPQYPENNRIVWKVIERQVHDLVGSLKDGKEVYVVTGAIFGHDKIADKITVPTYMYKAIYSPSTGHVGVYIASNNNSLTVSAMSLRSFGNMTKIDPFPTLDADTKSKIKLTCH